MDLQPNIKAAILKEAALRGPEKSTCPSEIARKLFPGHWRAQVAIIREGAIAHQKQGLGLITQKAMPIDTGNIKGAIRNKTLI
ncbi:DUF3253 domain-containing protein [Pedobacter jeongneungensis]|uniref:DUF3253 domain-containing protein n=1 Tax=Pedobacter jeongneungensis TaxID=947309 RepID=UPI000469AF0E|nr:DUF3253 domain-containing protein [Pedobacter jeongneungensis]